MSLLVPGFTGSRSTGGNLVCAYINITAAQAVPDSTNTIITCLSTPAPPFVFQSSGGAYTITQNPDGSYTLPDKGAYIISVDNFAVSAGANAGIVNFWFQPTTDVVPNVMTQSFQTFYNPNIAANYSWTSQVLYVLSGAKTCYLWMRHTLGAGVTVGYDGVLVSAIGFQRINGPPTYT